MSLLPFFKDWIESADDLIKGRPAKLPVDKLALCVLCCTNNFFAEFEEQVTAYSAMKSLLARHTPGGDFPFQDGLTYFDKDYDFRDEVGKHHLNPRRRAFVEKMIELLEAEQ